MRKAFSRAKKDIRWFFVELIKMYSAEKSFFSKKRIESGFAFIVAQWGMIFFLYTHMPKLTMGEFLLWAGAEFGISGYIINQIQKEKKEIISEEIKEETN